MPDDTWISKADDAKIRADLKDAPPELRTAYETGGLTAYNKVVYDWYATELKEFNVNYVRMAVCQFISNDVFFVLDYMY